VSNTRSGPRASIAPALVHSPHRQPSREVGRQPPRLVVRQPPQDGQLPLQWAGPGLAGDRRRRARPLMVGTAHL
jgi:hypothetical protein